MKHVDLNSAFNHIKPERIVEISKKLIRVPSVTGNERNVVLLAQDIIRDLGIDTKLYGTDERPILTAAIISIWCVLKKPNSPGHVRVRRRGLQAVPIQREVVPTR